MKLVYELTYVDNFAHCMPPEELLLHRIHLHVMLLASLFWCLFESRRHRVENIRQSANRSIHNPLELLKRQTSS